MSMRTDHAIEFNQFEITKSTADNPQFRNRPNHHPLSFSSRSPCFHSMHIASQTHSLRIANTTHTCPNAIIP